MCILRSGSVFWHFVKLWVIEWEELIIKDMAMHTIVLLLEAAGNVNRKAKVFHAMHNWILNGLLMTLAGASQQHCCVFYTHKYISIRLGSCMYVLLTSELQTESELYKKNLGQFANSTVGSKALTRERELLSQPQVFFSSSLSQPNVTGGQCCLERKIGAEIHALVLFFQSMLYCRLCCWLSQPKFYITIQQ